MQLKFSMATFLVFVFFYVSMHSQSQANEYHVARFSEEVEELQDYFQIPGIAVHIQKGETTLYQDFKGYSDVKNQIKLDSDVVFPIASLTKVFSSVLIMQLVEEGKVMLDDAVHDYLPNSSLPKDILLKHLISHTSQGEIGKHFYYSSRFSLVSQIIEKITQSSFAEVMDRRILTPLHLKNTFLLRDSLELNKRNVTLAKPYLFGDSLQEGFVDYGYSAAAGIVSNLEDLTKFNTAVDRNELLTEESKETMFSPFKERIPYGYGVFSQMFENEKIVWAYGQYDCYSSLLLKVPSRDLTLIMLANNSMLSDPARLIYGDIKNSLFALSFLENFVLQTQTKKFERNQLLAKALAASYMARFHVKNMDESIKHLDTLFYQNPNYIKYADLSLLHNLAFLKDVAFHRELGAFYRFDRHLEEIGEMLSKIDPNNPYLNIYLGTYYDRKGAIDKARVYYEKIIKTPNFSKNWYTIEAQQWLDARD